MKNNDGNEPEIREQNDFSKFLKNVTKLSQTWPELKQTMLGGQSTHVSDVQSKRERNLSNEKKSKLSTKRKGKR